MKLVRHNDTTLTLELSRRNLETLLDKLDDPLSARTLTKNSEDGEDYVRVVAIEGDDEETVMFVKGVEDSEHYKTRPPGEVYMPTTGERR